MTKLGSFAYWCTVLQAQGRLGVYQPLPMISVNNLPHALPWVCKTVYQWAKLFIFISDSKSCLSSLNWPRSEKSDTFWHFFGWWRGH